jgi:hypothetical protein
MNIRLYRYSKLRSIDLNTFKLLHSYEIFRFERVITASCLIGILLLISFNRFWFWNLLEIELMSSVGNSSFYWIGKD